MSDTDWLMATNLTLLVITFGLGIDRVLWEQERIIKRMIKKMKVGERCVLCSRPIKIIGDECSMTGPKK